MTDNGCTIAAELGPMSRQSAKAPTSNIRITTIQLYGWERSSQLISAGISIAPGRWRGLAHALQHLHDDGEHHTTCQRHEQHSDPVSEVPRQHCSLHRVPPIASLS